MGRSPLQKMIKCSTCKFEKSEDEFHKNGRTKNGLANACKSCMVEYKKAWWVNGGREKEKVRSASLSSEKTTRMTEWKRMNPARRLWQGAKKRASNRGMEFNIPWTEVVIPETCPILGIKIETQNNVIKESSPSLDRIDNSKGYVIGNVRVISHRANALKNNLTLEQAERLVGYMRSVCK